jgi:glutaredoxin
MKRTFAAFALLALIAGQGCRADEKSEGTSKPNPATPSNDELPPLLFNDKTPDLLITWIDEKGDFSVVQKVADVPREARQAVRVVQVGREEGTGKLVYVADLNETTPEGNYRVKTMSRAAWDELGASRRKARLEALAPSSAPPPSSSVAGAAPPKLGANSAAKVNVIIYGASWCKPCHDAAAYLRARSINVTEKDIDDSDAARSEMQRKLERAGLGGAQIPVIDVMGQILIGYSPRALDRAIEAARASKPL